MKIRSFLKKLKNYYLYGGLDKEEYHLACSYLYEEMHRTWTNICLICAITFTCITAYSLIFTSALPTSFIPHYIMMGYFVIAYFLMRFALKKDQILWINFFVYLSLTLILAFGLYIGYYGATSQYCVTFMVLLVAAPMLVIDRPYRTSAIVFLAGASSVAITLILEIGEVKEVNLFNSIVFTFVSILIHAYFVSFRMQGFLAKYRINRLAHYDILTDLENELSYVEMVQGIDEAIKKKEKQEFALLMCDVNGVKYIDDTFGHIYGCAVIVEGGHFLKRLFPHSRCFHVGGDEYIVKLEGEDFTHREERLVEFENKMANYFIQKDGMDFRVSLANGISEFDPNKDKRFDEVLSRADKVMYKKKKEMKEKYKIASRKED